MVDGNFTIFGDMRPHYAYRTTHDVSEKLGIYQGPIIEYNSVNTLSLSECNLLLACVSRLLYIAISSSDKLALAPGVDILLNLVLPAGVCDTPVLEDVCCPLSGGGFEGEM